MSVLARSFDLRLGASAVAPRAGCQRARRDGNRRRPKRQQNRTQSASFLHAMLNARSLEFGPRASCPIDATVTRRLASKARKARVRHHHDGTSHGGAFVRNIRHKREFKSGNRVTVWSNQSADQSISKNETTPAGIPQRKQTNSNQLECH
jgi:hypothetical protein